MLVLWLFILFVFNSLTEIWFIYHKIHMFKYIIEYIVSYLSSYHNKQWNIFITTKRNPIYILLLSIPPPSPALSNQSLFSASIYLPFFDVSYKWNHTTCDFLCLASFSKHNVSGIHLCCSMYGDFALFYCWVMFSCMGIPHFVHFFACWWTFRLLLPFRSFE